MCPLGTSGMRAGGVTATQTWAKPSLKLSRNPFPGPQERARAPQAAVEAWRPTQTCQRTRESGCIKLYDDTAPFRGEMTVSQRRRRRLPQAHAPQAHAPHSPGRSRVRGAPDSAVRQRPRLSRTELTGRGASASSPCRPRPVTRVRRGESALAPRPQHGPPLNGAREACDDQAGRHGDSGGWRGP